LEVLNGWSLDSLSSEIPLVAVRETTQPHSPGDTVGPSNDRPRGDEVDLGLGLQGTA
jgi:hypothetical protein